MRDGRIARGIGVVAASGGALFLLTGCPNPNLYTTPRTLEPGKLQWNVAAEGIGVNFDYATVDAAGNPTTKSASVILPNLPSFGVRYGVVDGFEIGAHLQNMVTGELDGKIRLLKGTFDVALDPGVQAFNYSVNSDSITVAYLHLPLLLGLNLSKSVSIVASPGFAWAVVAGTVSDNNGIQGASATSGAIGRLGVGFDFRIGQHFALHPEITFMKAFSSTDALFYVFGLGFNFGAMPDYSDLEPGGGGGGNTPPPPPSGPAPAPPQ
jgi:hypothetical protein